MATADARYRNRLSSIPMPDIDSEYRKKPLAKRPVVTFPTVIPDLCFTGSGIQGYSTRLYLLNQLKICHNFNLLAK
jgi:hypothetical protein